MPYITSIQKYSIHDGDGIRTTIFFKGCKLNCVWCHNPETQKYSAQIMQDKEKCVACGACIPECPEGAIQRVGDQVVTDYGLCKACGACIDACLLNLREMCGKEYTIRELVKEVEKDEMFYEQSGGGVTLSGGEVMTMDIDYIEQLVKALHKRGFTITIDTCGQAPYENYERILPYVDTFLYDIKTMDTELHKQYMGAGNELVLSNLIKISDAGARIYIRIPTITEVNGNDTSMKETIQFLLDHRIKVAQVNLLPYHNIGASKYDKMGRTYEGNELTAPSNETMEHFVKMFQDAGFHNTKIGG